jgi:hypothetical protein
MMSCCPPGSEGYLAADYNVVGKVIESKSYEYYISESVSPSTNGIVLFPGNNPCLTK